MKLIFIHGSGGCKEVWYYQTRHFAEADAVALPGHPRGRPCTSVDSYVEWLRGYIRDAGHRDAVLTGHSLGGAIALLYALKYPEDLKGLITIGSGARLRVNTLYLEMMEQAKRNRSIFEDFFRKSYEFIEPKLKDILLKKALEGDPAVLLNDMLCCDRFDIMDRVHEIKLPTLALCGSKDIMTPPKYTKYLASKIEGAREVIIERGTHMVFAEQPGVVNQAIEDYLNSL